MYRNALVLREAQHNRCQYCGADDGTTVAAHSNQQRHGKGMGIKAHDCFVAYLCFRCHSWIDQGCDGAGGAHRASAWDLAHKRSIPLFSGLLDDEGLELLRKDGQL